MIEPTDEMIQAYAEAWDAADPAVKHRPERVRSAIAAVLAIVERDRLAELAEFRDKLAALAAIEDYIGESGENAARNMRDLLAGRGDDNGDPRVQARRWGLDWEVPR